MQIQIFLPHSTGDFTLLDSGAGTRLEQWGSYILQRPDPQALWQPSEDSRLWQKANAIFSAELKSGWKENTLPKSWITEIGNLKLNTRLTPFKHTGVFIEQAANWEFMNQILAERTTKQPIKILNLFGYTGAASCSLALAGCQVTHVDASKPAIGWAKENQALNNLAEDSIRWILDDAAAFVKRELKRGQTYDGILLDPPAYGRSPNGKVWKFKEHFPELLKNCIALLSRNPQFLLINSYASNLSALALDSIVRDELNNYHKTQISTGELCLQQKNQRILSTGICSRVVF